MPWPVAKHQNTVVKAQTRPPPHIRSGGERAANIAELDARCQQRFLLSFRCRRCKKKKKKNPPTTKNSNPTANLKTVKKGAAAAEVVAVIIILVVVVVVEKKFRFVPSVLVGKGKGKR